MLSTIYLDLYAVLCISVSDSDAEIIQLSAAYGQDEFNAYIMPRMPIRPQASEVNHLTVSNEGKLCFMGKPITAEASAKDALKQFINWLRGHKEPVVLFAHDAKRFFSKHLVCNLEKHDLVRDFVESNVIGFVDVLTLFKKRDPGRKTGYSLKSLMEDTFDCKYDPIYPLEKVGAIQKLLLADEFSTEKCRQLVESSFTVNYAVKSTMYCLNMNDNLKTLKPIIKKNVISESIGKKIAGSGLRLSHLKFVYKSAGEPGLEIILSQKTAKGTCRVTKTKRVILKLQEYFKNA
jgi:hypothetical protein